MIRIDELVEDLPTELQMELYTVLKATSLRLILEMIDRDVNLQMGELSPEFSDEDLSKQYRQLTVERDIVRQLLDSCRDLSERFDGVIENV